ncbi:MAG: DUF4279 domain-containing protein [Limisphaerales bacterium]
MGDRQQPVLTYAFLRLEHDTADPQEVTAMLGVTPTSSVRRGGFPACGAGEPVPWNVWLLSSEHSVVSRDCLAHIQWLLASIGPRGPELGRLRERGYRMRIHCVWAGRPGYGGPELTPDVMGPLALLGIDLWFDVVVLHHEPTLPASTTP